MNLVYRRSHYRKKSEVKLENDLSVKGHTELPKLPSLPQISERVKHRPILDVSLLMRQNKWSQVIAILQKNKQKRQQLYNVMDLPLVLIHQKGYQKAYEILKNLNENQRTNEINLLLSLCCYKNQDIQTALAHLQGGCAINHLESLFLAAKCYIKIKNYVNANKMLNNILQSTPDHQPALTLKGYILFHTGEWNQLIEHSDSIKLSLKAHRQLKQCIIWKAHALMQKRQYQLALKELQNMEQNLGQDSEILVQKGKVLMKMGQTIKAIAEWSEALLVNNNQNSSTQEATCLLALHYLNQCDFYEAYTVLRRAIELYQISSKINCLATLTEGVIFLMKRKFTDAINLLESINLQSLKPFDQRVFLSNIYYHALGYGYFAIAEHDKALQMYSLIQDGSSVSHLYNKCLCQGVLAYKNQNIKLSLKSFNEAISYIARPEPYFYLAVITAKKTSDQTLTKDQLLKVLQITNEGLKMGQNCHLLYFRALVQLNLGQSSNALEDLDKAIQRSEQNIASFFFLRGLIFELGKSYTQAINQFMTCLSIDEDFDDAIVQKAKCEFMNGNPDTALTDIENHPNQREWTAIFNLYLHNFKEIAKQDLGQCPIMHNANFFLGQFEAAGPAGRLVLAIIFENYDQVQQLLSQAITANLTVGCLQVQDLIILRAYCCFKIKKYDESIKLLFEAESMLKIRSQNQQQYSDQDQRKILVTNINVVLMQYCKGDIKQALLSLSALLQQVYEGEVKEQLLRLQTAITSGDSIDLQIMAAQSFLSDLLPEEQSKGVRFRFMIPFARVRAPEFQEAVHERLLSGFNIDCVENKPEAVWIRRNSDGVIFTSNVRLYSKLDLKTQQTQKATMLQNLKINSSVLKKLQKITKKAEKKRNSTTD